MAEAAYLASLLILCHVTVLRLRMVASPSVAMKAWRLLKAFMIMGVVSVVLKALLDTLAGAGALYAIFVVIALICVLVFVLAFIYFQSYALFSFATVARIASEEAQRSGRAAHQQAARRALVTAAFLSASAGTTVLFCVVLVASSR